MHFSIMEDKIFFLHVNFVRPCALGDSLSRAFALESTQGYKELLKNWVTYFTIVCNSTFEAVHFHF
jgi:hypothetical protein